MIKKLIVGSGFSASIVNIILGNKAKIFGINDLNKIRPNGFIRRKNLDCNKVFCKKSLSIGSIRFHLKSSTFHDRPLFGGNSSVWGGHINYKKIPKKLINILNKRNVFFQKLSYSITGTNSSTKYITQLQNSKGEIFRSNDLIENIENAIILDLSITKKKIFTNILFLDSNKKKRFEVNKLYLCVGTIQLIDLLFRSKLLNQNDEIELTEFDHEFIFKFKNSKFIKKATTIRYCFGRAIGHFLGIQSFAKFLKIFNFIPIFIDQIFYNTKTKIVLILKGNTFIEKNKDNSKKFGKSIHYCNMKINGVPIDKFLSKKNKNLIGFGMPFVNQKIPGPISNDILLDIKNKIIKN